MAKAEEIGEYLGVKSEGERVVSHYFDCLKAGYKGWVWVVCLARVPRSRQGTVSETNLIPAQGALLAPSWIPWADRLQPGDLDRKDKTPYNPDDPNLQPAYQSVGGDADRLANWELGLGRKRVLSLEGRNAAVKRWLHNPHSRSELDRKGNPPENPCSTCGYLWKVSGSLRLEFGLCTNAWSPDDGHVVAMDHACGAHSETDAVIETSKVPESGTHLDDQSLVVVPMLNPSEDSQDDSVSQGRQTSPDSSEDNDTDTGAEHSQE